jgi:hypothetical protein
VVPAVAETTAIAERLELCGRDSLSHTQESHRRTIYTEEDHMVHGNGVLSPARAAIVRWAAGLGAVTAEALADREGVTVASARARLQVVVRAGMLLRQRPLVGQPALYTVTRAGLRQCGVQGLDPCRVSASSAHHSIVCARVAAALEHCYPDYVVTGERELRREEREQGVQLASAQLGVGPGGAPLLHRPDLVLWARQCSKVDLPIAVELELTVKASARLSHICQAWARCRCVSGVLYLAPPEVERALHRAIEQAQAQARVVVVPLEAVPGSIR